MAGLGLNIGLSGMLSSQRALEVLGHNMSNANTPGYSRQRLQLGASRLHLHRGSASCDTQSSASVLTPPLTG